MEDNIGDMMVEIQNVVSNHLSNVKKDLQDTMNVINKLPLVISLRNQIRKLENENKQLKMLVDSIGEEKNIELETKNLNFKTKQILPIQLLRNLIIIQTTYLLQIKGRLLYQEYQRNL